MEFSRSEYWSGDPFPSPGSFPTQGSNPGLPHCRQTLSVWATRETQELAKWTLFHAEETACETKRQEITVHSRNSMKLCYELPGSQENTWNHPGRSGRVSTDKTFSNFSNPPPSLSFQLLHPLSLWGQSFGIKQNYTSVISVPDFSISKQWILSLKYNLTLSSSTAQALTKMSSPPKFLF